MKSMNHFRHLLLSLLMLLAVSTVFASSRNVNDNDTVPLPGNVHPIAQPMYDRGLADANLRYDKMILVLPQRQGAQAAIAKLIAQQHDPKSPMFHKWLTPDQFGQQFGISKDDLQDVLDWLHRGGFTIDHVAPGMQWINFSGTAADVTRVFKTEIHNYQYNGQTYHANSKNPEVPRALLDIVGGVVSLHNVPKHPMNDGIRPVNPELIKKRIAPEYTSGSNHYLAPADFATIYNVNSLYSAGINGSGQTIAIVGRTDISLADVQYFRSFFGLPANDPVFVHNGTDPGNLGGGEEGEADLDVEWSGAVAQNATIKFVISASTSTTDGVDLSAQYIVTNNLAPVMSLSFGQCESSMGATQNTFYNNLWSQAATQGITAFVSSGDSGAAGCDGGSATTGTGAAVSGLASTPYNVAVGGSQFADTTNPTLYWNSTNAANQSSARSYIPEVAWNESGNVSGGSGLWASSGGVSSIYAKPSWQSCVGVPNDGKRDVPDVALTAAGHDGYLVVQGHTSTVSGLGAVGGTSASSPSFAGLMALVVQKTGARQGNANTKFYSLANAQYTGTGPTIFHDITSGNNSVPGVTGFNCGTGYDAVTGVGTVDANAMVNNWSGSATPDFAISASPTSVSAMQGSSTTSTITTTVSGGFNNAVSLSATGAPTGTTVAFSPTSIAAPGNGSSTMTVTVGAATATGTYSITVTGTGGSTSHTAVVTLTVTSSGGGGGGVSNGGFETGTLSGWTSTGVAAVNTSAKHTGTYGAQLGNGSPSTDSTISQTFTMPATSPSLSFWYANTCPDTVTYDWATATVTDNVTSTTTTLLAKTCTATPAWTQVTWNGAASAGHSVTLTLTNHDDNYAGDPTFTYFDDVTVSGGSPTPAFTISASPTSVSAVQGTNATSTISTTVSGGFNSAIALSASGAPTGTTVSFSPTSIAAPGSGSSTMTMSVGASTAVGTYTITVTGSGGSITHTATVTLTVTAAPVPAFTISASPTSASAVQGGSATSTISTTVSGGFNSAIALTASGAPTGTSVSFNPSSIAAPGSGSSTMTMSVGASTAVGTYTITVTGSGGSITHTATVTLTVTSAPVPAFTISASPTSASAAQGGSATSTISTTVSGGFNSAIALSASGAPTGTSVSFNPTSIAAPGSGSSTMTMSVGASTAVGTYTITVTGSGGSITHTATVTLTVTTGGGTPQQLLGNPGFENGSASPAPWTTTTGVIDSSAGEAAHSGTWKAWLDGYGTSHTDTVQQTVTIPSTVTSATLSFYLHIDTAETTTTTAYDTLQVQIRNSSGTVLATLATYSNLNAATGYTQKSFNVLAYKGQTIQVYLVGTEDTSAQTSFVVDDFALNVQ
jgi:pseudomonalisin